MKEQLAALYALQQLDSAIDLLRRQYATLDKGETERAAYETAKAAQTSADSDLHRAQATLRDTELEQKSVEEKRASEEKRLYSGKVTNPKELQAIQQEVEMLARQRSHLDEKILVLIDDLEQRRRVEAEARQALGTASAALKTKLDAYKQEAETLVTQAKELAAQRNAAVKPLPADLLKRYENLRANRHGLAVVAIVDGNACGGCRMALPSNLVRQVQDGSRLEVCQNCGRILVVSDH